MTRRSNKTWAGMTEHGRKFHIVTDSDAGWMTACQGLRVSDTVLVAKKRKPRQQVVLPAHAIKPHARCKRCFTDAVRRQL